ncbi:MAG: hypothetical protein IPL61_10195 [Myxococcales bacterium]|nr:hypothetical protein [Myxococcales bacterium]
MPGALPQPPFAPATARPVQVAVPGLAPLRDGFFLPFASGRHPDTDAIAEGNLAWLRDHGLLDQRSRRTFERARFHELAGRVYHREDRDALRLAADFIAALFVLDDRMDTGRDAVCRDPARAQAAIDGLRLAARSGRPPARRREGLDAVASALADLTRRLEARGAPTGAYLDELDAYLDGVVEETRRRRDGFTSVADYADVRVAFSAVDACVALGLAVEGRTLPPSLRPLARAANLSVSWINDVFSWPKERALGEPSNLIRVLAEHEQLDETAAFHAACRACDDVVRGYLIVRAATDHDRAALDLLERWMQGNYDWHACATARYTDHLSVAPAAAAAA